MDCPPPCLDFAVIGHQDSWQNIADFINGVRSDGMEALPTEKIKDIFPFIPPRDLFRVKVRSATGASISGVYIDTFIDPGKLDSTYARANISKVIQAASHAQKMGARMVALGGFTSIVLEGNLDLLISGETKFTTGNTLTAAYIVKGIEKAALLKNIEVSQSTMLVIGATGDIGMACINYFRHKVKKFLLCARNQQRLEKLSQRLGQENILVDYSGAMQALASEADIIICVASTAGMTLDNCKKNVLICDAGYPKNVASKTGVDSGVNLFHGGMGHVSQGYDFIPDYSDTLYRYPAPYIIHGCILEAMILAFEKKIENYSAGKGNITTEKMEEIYRFGIKHGIVLAPFYSDTGLW